MEEKEKKSKKKIIIPIIIVVVLLLVGLLLFFLLKGDKKVTITFDSDGGTTVEKQEIKKGGTITLPTSTKEGFNLDGWYIDETKVTGTTTFDKDTTVKAKWTTGEKKTYTITFDSKGGTEVAQLKVECDTELTLPAAPTKEGYNFVSWVDKNETPILDKALLSCEDVTLYANWEKKEDKKEEKKYYTVTFDSKGGSKVNPIKVECGKTLTLPSNPTRSGYNFVSWYDKNGKTILTGALLSCEDITLYADWKELEKETPQKQYKCPSGYTLAGTKCTMEGTVKETCPEGTKTDGTLCIKTSDSNGGTRQCKSYTVSTNGKGNTWTGKGNYYMVGNSYGKCAYYKWDGYKTKEQCDAANDIYHKTTWVSELNGCFAETYITFPNGETSYETVCASDYQYYTSDQLSSKFGIHDNAKCLKKVDKTKYCDEGYTLTSGKCIKTIDATYE